jgi:hypothetical protein
VIRWILILVAAVVGLMTVFLLWSLFTTTKAAELPPLPFPLELGASVDEVRESLKTRFGTDEGSDQVLDYGENFRQLSYGLEPVEGGAVVMIHYGYRADDRRIWSISVGSMEGRYDGTLGAVPLRTFLRDVRRILGRPAATVQRAPVIRSDWWDAGDLGYQVDSYTESDGGHRPGQVDFIKVYSKSLGPAGYDGDRKAAD